MAVFVRGSGIEKATAYDLLRKVGDTYEKVWRKTFGKQQPEIMSGYINESGASATSQYAKYSEMIDVTDFDENDNTTQAFTMLSSIAGVSGALVVAFYTKKEDYTSFVYGYTADELTELWGADYTGANLVAFAQQHKANYVVFTVDVNADLWYYTPNKINFRLDEYVNFWNVLPAGQTHYLAVKAIGEGGVDLDGDGKIYADSGNGGDASGEPLVYAPAVEAKGEVILDEFTGKTLKGGTYGEGGALYGIQTNLPQGTYISAIDIPAAQGSTYSNPTSPITLNEIKIYRISTNGLIEEELFSGTNIASAANDEGTQIYHLEINKLMPSVSNIGIWVNPANTTSAPTIPYCNGQSSLGKCYFGATKTVGDTIAFDNTSFNAAFIIYN